jgi:hypothetical protein
MRVARPGAIRAVQQRVIGWRMHLAACLIATLALTGCSGSRASEESASSSTTVPVAPGVPVDAQPGPFRIGPAPAYAGIATMDTTVYEAPRGNSAITAVFPVRLPWGSPASFRVRQAYRDAADRTWFEVFLPRRPNGSTGWIPGDQVRPRPMLHQVEVDLSSRTVRLLRDGRTVRSWPVGIGRRPRPLQQVASMSPSSSAPSHIGRVRGVGPRDLGLLRRAGTVRHRRRPDRVTRHYRPGRPRSRGI